MLPFPHEEEISLKDYCTLGIGGPARFFARCDTADKMCEMVAYCTKTGLGFLILGKGSNVLFDDRGFNGLVILNRIDYLHQVDNRFTVSGGYSFARLGKQTARLGYSGLEFAAGIPASVGGAVFMNAGASGQETAAVIESVKYINEKGECEQWLKKDLSFSYRHSPFQERKGVIVEATFVLQESPCAHAAQQEAVEYRLKTQPYKDKSAGCIFRNAPCSSAGKLLEECGWKGKEWGGAAVSTMHANFLINKQNATAAEVKILIEKIKEDIYAKRGILLQEEVRFITYEPTI